VGTSAELAGEFDGMDTVNDEDAVPVFVIK
jgi:hypothetical protein